MTGFCERGNEHSGILRDEYLLTVSMTMKFKEHLDHKLYFIITHLQTLSVSQNAWSRMAGCLFKN
jgi:hypothetical protein